MEKSYGSEGVQYAVNHFKTFEYACYKVNVLLGNQAALLKTL